MEAWFELYPHLPGLEFLPGFFPDFLLISGLVLIPQGLKNKLVLLEKLHEKGVL